MQLINYIKYDILGRPLELYKTGDYCVSKMPRMTVILLHGIASSSSGLKNAVKYLKGTKSLGDVRIVTYDLLGAGKSYRSKKLKYNYAEMGEALENSIKKLEPKTPIVLVGHSMGSLITAYYATRRGHQPKKVILASPAFYTPEDIENPDFDKALTAFKKSLRGQRRKDFVETIFDAEMEKIVKNPKNYEYLTKLTAPTVMIYGDEDPLIRPKNLKKAAKENSHLKLVKTHGRHGLSREKYNKIREILEETK